MGNSPLQRLTVPFPCPNCGNEVEVTLGDSTFYPDVVCSVCGVEMDVDTSQFQSVLNDIEDSLSDLDIDIDITIE